MPVLSLSGRRAVGPSDFLGGSPVARPVTMSGDWQPRPPAIAPSRWFARYPVTTLLGLQYGALAVLPAWRNGNPDVGFVVWIVVAGLFSSLVVETLLRPLHYVEGRIRPRSIVTTQAACAVIVIGFIALYGSAALGARTYATQVGSSSSSPLAALATPFTLWTYVGCGFLLYCFARGDVGRRRTLAWLAAAEAAYLGYALYIGITAPFASFSLALATASLLVGLCKPKWLVVGLLAASLAWPTIYQYRNAHRANASVSSLYGQEVSATDRLREDTLLALARHYPASMHIGQPSALDMARYGLVPSAIDPFNRAELATGKTLNAAVGHSATSSLTFTVLGNIRALGGGTAAMMLVVGLLSVVFTLVSRELTPIRLVLVLALTKNLIWVESMYPDGLAGALQAWASGLCALLFIAMLQGARRELGRRLHPAAYGNRHPIRNSPALTSLPCEN